MTEAIPELNPAGDERDDTGPDATGVAPVSDGSTDMGSGDPTGKPRAKNREELFQTKYDKVVSQTGKLLSSNYLKTLGPDGIIRALEQFEAVISDPSIRKNLESGALVQGIDGKWQYRATQKAAAVDAAAGMNADAGTGDYEDPLVKQIEARMEAKYGQTLAAMNEQIQALRQRNDTALTETGAQKVAELTRRFLANYPLSPEEKEEFSEKIGPRIGSLDPTVLLKMTDEQFEDYVGLPNVKKFLPAILARKARQRGTQLSALATDANGAASLGADGAPVAKQKPMSWSQLQKTLAAAAERAAREPA